MAIKRQKCGWDNDYLLKVAAAGTFGKSDCPADLDRRRQVNILLPDPEDIMPLTSAVFERAEALVRMGFAAADAVHVASAEAHGADVMLSCDDRLVRRTRRMSRRLSVEVENPLIWLGRWTDAQDA
jgi:hypothetical protein